MKYLSFVLLVIGMIAPFQFASAGSIGFRCTSDADQLDLIGTGSWSSEGTGTHVTVLVSGTMTVDDKEYKFEQTPLEGSYDYNNADNREELELTSFNSKNMPADARKVFLRFTQIKAEPWIDQFQAMIETDADSKPMGIDTLECSISKSYW